MQSNAYPVMEARNLCKAYAEHDKSRLFGRSFNQAVQEVSFQIWGGETFGIVGESGCGKSTVAKLLMGLEKPDGGEVIFQGRRIDRLSESELRPIRPRFQMVFQDSGSSLNGRKCIADILAEPMIYHGVIDRQNAQARVDELLDMVGLPADVKSRYPHEFSGGQRQRICIAKALSLKPELIILDEPVSALDVSVQAQILNLLRDLQEQLGLSYLFIGHGLGAVHYISHRIAVMYRGKIVEYGESDELFRNPTHPYTQALLDATPSADYDLRNRQRIVLKGEAEAADWSGGCAFRGRCPYGADCGRSGCELLPLSVKGGHFTACSRTSGRKAL